MINIEFDRIVECINSSCRNYLNLLDDFEKVTSELNKRLEYKIILHPNKPYINCSINQLGLSSRVSYSDIEKLMDEKGYNRKQAIIKYLEDFIIDN